MLVQQVGQVGPGVNAQLLAQAAPSAGAVVEQPLTLGGGQDLQARTDCVALAPRESGRTPHVERVHSVCPHAAPEGGRQPMAAAVAGAMALLTALTPAARALLAAVVAVAAAGLVVLALR